MNHKLKKWITFIGLVLCLSGITQAGYAQFNPYYKPLRSGSYVQDKAYYLFTCFNQLPGVKHLLLHNPVLRNIYDSKMKAATSIRNRILQAQNDGKLKNLKVSVFEKANISPNEITHKLEFSDKQISAVSSVLQNYARKNKAIKQLIDEHLRPSGKFQLYASDKDPELLQKAWELTARGMNHAIEVYALGKGARYAEIDSTSFNVNSRFYQTMLSSLIMGIGNNTNGSSLFFAPSLKYLLGLLKINHRNEAARFEPLSAGENYKAYQHIPEIKWSRYSYSAILVPGYGTITYKEEMNPMGKLRCELAAKRFKEGKAPIIIVSGGFVHPFQTKHNEAYEMKKYLMTKLSIPEEDIIMEPYARHTTSNFRDAVRLMFHYGIPTNKKDLVVTTASQSYYITNMGLDKRCKEELGYVPYTSLKRLTVNDVEFLPNINALQCDPAQPLDP